MKSRLTLFESLAMLVLAIFAILLVPIRAFASILSNSLVHRLALTGMRGIDITSDLGKLSKAWGLVDAAGGVKGQAAQPKTANYTVLAASDPSDSLFTNRGAVGAVTFTLPAPTQTLKGCRYRFAGVADQTFTVSAGAASGVAFNNAACASLACSTGGQKIGAVILAECDGTSWILSGVTVGVTYTVA